MPPLNGKIVYAGLAKQTAKGSAAANATYNFGVESGTIIEVPIAQELMALTLPGATGSDRFQPHAKRIAAVPAAKFSTLAYPQLAGMFGYGALGAISTSGAGPYSHTETPALTLPYYTLFAQFANGERVKLPDCQFDKLGISWDEREPVMLAVELLGLVPAFGASSFTGTDVTTSIPYDPIGGTFQHDVDGAVLGESKITGGSIEIANELKPINLSKALTPDDFSPGVQSVTGTFDITPNDFTDLRAILTGGPAGTALSNDPIYGSFSMKHAIDASTELTDSANRVSYLADFPEASSEGDAQEIPLAFEVVRPTDASAAFTHLVKNAVVSY